MPVLSELSFDITRLHAAYAEGTNPADIIAECYRRIAEADDPGIFLHLLPEGKVRTAAEALGAFDPAAMPLWGVPFAVKDNIDVAGAPTTAACPTYAYTPEADAFVVARLREAGALLIGKTNLDQFATGLVGVRSPYPVPRNAIDPELVPGGSSSGSAVAVSRGIVSFALGTDTAGSGRVPAALNNIVGLKPSLGALSNTGVVPACRTLDTISVFAPSVGDAYSVFRAAAVYDPADAYARPAPTPPLGAAPVAFKLGVPDEASRRFFGDRAQAKAFEADLEALVSLGAEIVPLDFAPFYEVADLLYEGAWVAERYAVVEDFLHRNPDALHPTTHAIVTGARALSAADAFRGLYRLKALERALEPVIDGVDLLCVPTIPTVYSRADLEANPIGPNSRLGTYTNFVNLLDLAALAVPTRAREDGRPGSATLIARRGRDAALAAIGARLHRQAQVSLGATDHRLPSATWTAGEEPPSSDDTILFAVGAHMSGLPLNGELTERGASLIGPVETAASYRLYSLPGGPPARPGLVRVSAGASIAGELWRVPTAAIGDLLKGVPSPLGFGSVHLADGRTVLGFLCEAEAVHEAQDISHYGSWRSFLAAEARTSDAA
ncbi:MAG: allophanate hydrolase [Pseudomonadota bacterium]